ncbi:hypothetical protein RFI_31396 [Reticulomyxa filosa]|uniref:t-SNARE coiled-coil homology domain-containing protein n=1 Tax=Reticulomyxa filosa TaxID=46433 RepID=X6LWL1_RETFI|nr:hypothetical protein RFI_31396 [Reticulomyxa filosa]|eukprot:ETO05999.1 hypothetical protein RFI_31396 [Reticulomyxa filosa]
MNFFDDTKRLFLRESQQMLQAIESEKDEVLLAEQKTNEICSLLEMFTENITSQDTVIGTIESIVTQSVDDLKTGNKEVKQKKEIEGYYTCCAKGLNFFLYHLFLLCLCTSSIVRFTLNHFFYF